MKNPIKSLTLAIVLVFCVTAAFAQEVLVDTKKSYSNIKNIEVEGGWLDVSYTGGSNSEVKVDAYLESTNENQDIIFVSMGNVLKISYKQSSSNFSWGGNRNKGHIIITGPSTIDLNIKNSSGTIAVKNVTAENTNLRVSSGKITASDIHGNITLRATSGSLNLSDIDGDVNAGVTSGSARFYHIIGDVDYESTSGSLEATKIRGELNASITSGNVKLEDIVALGRIKFTSGNVRATHAGLTGNTSFTGTSGNFKIQTDSNLKEFNFSLKASSGNLKVGSLNTNKNLEIDNNSREVVRGTISSGNISIVN